MAGTVWRLSILWVVEAKSKAIVISYMLAINNVSDKIYAVMDTA